MVGGAKCDGFRSVGNFPRFIMNVLWFIREHRWVVGKNLKYNNWPLQINVVVKKTPDVVKHVKSNMKAVLTHFIPSVLRWILFPIFPCFCLFTPLLERRSSKTQNSFVFYSSSGDQNSHADRASDTIAFDPWLRIETDPPMFLFSCGSLHDLGTFWWLTHPSQLRLRHRCGL